MTVYRIIKTLENHKTVEWTTLVSEVLGTSLHPHRIEGFLRSREALLQGMSDFGIQLKVQELKLEGFYRLIGYPDFTLSLSHSKEAGAVLIAKTAEFLSVGIDIEDEKRIVKDTVLARISHPHDVSLRKIELWCLKEAAFKALMNSQKFQLPEEFSSIEIGNRYWSHSPSGLKGEWELDIQDGLVVAKAFLKN